MRLWVLGTLVGAFAVVGGACVSVNTSLASSAEERVPWPARGLVSHGSQRIAFDISGKDDVGIIYTMRPDGSGARLFRYEGTNPALSSDGHRLLFTGEYPGGVFVAPLDGRGRRLIRGTRDIRLSGARWSPDGRSIVAGTDSDLGIYPVGAGEPRFVDVGAEPEDPDWSPDGRRIAYSADRTGIYVVSSSGGKPRMLTRAPRDAGDVEPRWSPDGKWLLFTRASTSYGIYVISSTGGKPRLLRTNASAGAWSPDGKRITYSGDKGRIHIFELASRSDRTLDVRPCRDPSFETGYCDNLDWR